MSSQQLIDLLRYINNRRLLNDVTPFSLREMPTSIVEKLLQAGHRLAVYAPSKLLSREMRELPGVWESAAVHGQLVDGDTCIANFYTLRTLAGGEGV